MFDTFLEHRSDASFSVCAQQIMQCLVKFGLGAFARLEKEISKETANMQNLILQASAKLSTYF